MTLAKLTSGLEVFVDSKYGHDKLIYGVKADVAVETTVPALLWFEVVLLSTALECFECEV